MKKRLLSLLLSLCLVAGLFAGMTPSAYAAGDTWVYTVKSGDTVSSICKANGIDFAKNQEWIQKTNNLNATFSIVPGQKLTLPAKGKVLTWVDGGTGTSGTGYTPGGSISGGVNIGTTTGGGFSVPTITYTMKNGDYVSAVCKKLGIDFAKNDAWIRAANNITSYNNMKVGTVLVLPAPGTTPALNTAGSGVAATTIAATTTTSAAGLLAGDSVAYYMFDYVVKSGDTLFNICNSVGADMNTVQQLNGITNPAALRVGQKLSIPSKVAPASGNYTRIVAHKVVSGDTVQAICTKYGTDYGKNAAKIKALNNRDNLDAIKVGQTILIPVSGAVSPSGSVAPASGGASAITNNTTGVAYYTLNLSPALNGTYALTVNGQSINGASAGQVVHVVATPDHYYKLSGISVTKAYNGAKVDVDKNNNFVMPACDVKIAVTFAKDTSAEPKDIYKSSVCGGVTMTYVVNGYANTKAEKGQTVSIVLGTLPSGQFVDKVYVTLVNPTSVNALTNGTIDPKNYVSVSSNLTFTMPASPVYVTILLKGA